MPEILNLRRNEGRPFKDIDTSCDDGLFNVGRIVEMKVVRLRTLTPVGVSVGVPSSKSRNEGRPFKDIDQISILC